MEILLGIALNDGQPAANTVLHAHLRKLDATGIRAFGLGQVSEQRTIATADVEHPRPWAHEIGDQPEILTKRPGADIGDGSIRVALEG